LACPMGLRLPLLHRSAFIHEKWCGPSATRFPCRNRKWSVGSVGLKTFSRAAEGQRRTRKTFLGRRSSVGFRSPNGSRCPEPISPTGLEADPWQGTISVIAKPKIGCSPETQIGLAHPIRGWSREGIRGHKDERVSARPVSLRKTTVRRTATFPGVVTPILKRAAFSKRAGKSGLLAPHCGIALCTRKTSGPWHAVQGPVETSYLALLETARKAGGAFR